MRCKLCRQDAAHHGYARARRFSAAVLSTPRPPVLRLPRPAITGAAICSPAAHRLTRCRFSNRVVARHLCDFQQPVAATLRPEARGRGAHVSRETRRGNQATSRDCLHRSVVLGWPRQFVVWSPVARRPSPVARRSSPGVALHGRSAARSYRPVVSRAPTSTVEDFGGRPMISRYTCPVERKSPGLCEPSTASQPDLTKKRGTSSPAPTS